MANFPDPDTIIQTFQEKMEQFIEKVKKLGYSVSTEDFMSFANELIIKAVQENADADTKTIRHTFETTAMTTDAVVRNQTRMKMLYLLCQSTTTDFTDVAKSVAAETLNQAALDARLSFELSNLAFAIKVRDFAVSVLGILIRGMSQVPKSLLTPQAQELVRPNMQWLTILSSQPKYTTYRSPFLKDKNVDVYGVDSEKQYYPDPLKRVENAFVNLRAFMEHNTEEFGESKVRVIDVEQIIAGLYDDKSSDFAEKVRSWAAHEVYLAERWSNAARIVAD